MKDLESRALRLIQKALDEKKADIEPPRPQPAQESDENPEHHIYKAVEAKEQGKPARIQTLGQGEKKLTKDELQAEFREILKIMDQDPSQCSNRFKMDDLQ
jgi:hypothetical protein